MVPMFTYEYRFAALRHCAESCREKWGNWRVYGSITSPKPIESKTLIKRIAKEAAPHLRGGFRVCFKRKGIIVARWYNGWLLEILIHEALASDLADDAATRYAERPNE